MRDFRYPQLCAMARAAEVIGERWTLLILRELFLGPSRFSDLKKRLGGVSPSVLSERLAHLEERGVVSRRELEPPAASTVYELTETGLALQPTMMELGRWGARFFHLSEPGDHFEPAWLELAIAGFARRSASPEISVKLQVADDNRQLEFFVWGGKRGTRTSKAPRSVDATLTAEGKTTMAIMSGELSVADAAAAGLIDVDGDVSKLEKLPDLFELKTGFDQQPRQEKKQ